MAQNVIADNIITAELFKEPVYLVEDYYIEIDGKIIKTFTIKEIENDTRD